MRKPIQTNKFRHINLLVCELEKLLSFGRTSKYQKFDYSRRIVETSIQNRSFEESFKMSKKLTADSVFNQIHKISFLDIQKLIDKILQKIKLPRSVDLAIDYTEKPFYGNRNNIDIIGSKNGKYVRKYIQLSTCKPNYFINCFRINCFTNCSKKPLDALIYYFKCKFPKTKIGNLYIDRGFYSKDNVDYFCENNINFLMPAVKNVAIKKLIDSFLKKKIKSKIKYKFGKNLVNLFFKKCGEEVYVFMSNKNLTIKKAFLMYKKRWNIETNFREQNKFTFKTKTLNFKTRYFAFVISGLLLNLWFLRRLSSIKLESYIFIEEVIRTLKNYRIILDVG